MDISEAEIVDGGEGSGVAPSESSPGRLAALLYPSQDAIARRNRIAWVLLFAMVPLAGSVLSVSVALLAIWALLSVMLGRFRFRLEAPDRPVAFSGLFLVAVLAVTDFLHQPPLGAALNALGLLFFVAPAVLVSRMRAGEGGPVLPAVYRGAAIGGCVLLPIVLTQYFVFDMQRVSGFEGNPGPLSVVALLTCGLALLDLSSKHPAGRNALALMGALGAIVALFLTGMRGSLPALPLVILIAVAARRRMLFGVWRRGSGRRRSLIAASCALAVAAVGLVVVPPLLLRLAETEANLDLLSTHPNAVTSIALRVDLYAAAWQAFLERPVFGWGASGLWQAVQPHLDPTLYNGFSFNHLHNIFLTVGVEAGLLGIAALILTIAAPLWTAWRWRSLPAGHDRLAFAAILISAYLIPGLTNIMFFHDILDSVWALSVATLCASVPVADEASAGSAARDRQW
ncbi:O-antigen ligase [Aurantimonas sp. VKM B-3413]|uniref:O-antigen ligase family protein n=1 Tax=Aurantimonas sp. VKM B-3413 TaxID=2779401 RepID=UPI001E566A6A|nr:O-antigen ligase family protein [Aurantimonas sp. VKM B-3413]MCB8837419.1 O-antigen ligase family protein [Aurantimonas sp. VKM B-3413]